MYFNWFKYLFHYVCVSFNSLKVTDIFSLIMQSFTLRVSIAQLLCILVKFINCILLIWVFWFQYLLEERDMWFTASTRHPIYSIYTLSISERSITVTALLIWNTGLPRSLPNADHGIDPKCLSMPIIADQCRSIPLNRNWSTLGSMPEFWSALGIDRGSPGNKGISEHLYYIVLAPWSCCRTMIVGFVHW